MQSVINFVGWGNFIYLLMYNTVAGEEKLPPHLIRLNFISTAATGLKISQPKMNLFCIIAIWY